MNLATALCLLSFLCMIQSHEVPAQEQPAQSRTDMIFLHGNVYTGVAGGSSFHEIKRAEAIAPHGDRLQEIGSNQHLMKLKGPDTEDIALGGRLVTPGLRDAHLPLASAGLERLN